MDRTLGSVKKKAQRFGLAPKCLPAEIRENWRPNATEYQVLMGSLLGDGSVRKTRIFEISHSIDQEPYLRWKMQLLARLHPQYIIYEHKAMRTFPKHKVPHMRTRTFENFGELRKEWYPTGKKIIPKSIWDIEPLGLAIWFQDDGNKNKTEFRFATHGFTRKDHLFLQRVMWEKFHIKSDIRQSTIKNKRYFYLNLNQRPALRFEKLVFSYIHPSMKYKLHNPVSQLC